MIRNIKIINRNNDVYDLNNINHIATDLSGLGADVTGSYININENFITSDYYVNQGIFSSNIIFGLQGSNAYDEFKKFSEFISKKNTPLYMQYTVNDNKYLRDIDVSSISKNEKDEYNLLTINASFKYKTPWYTIRTFTNKDFVNDSLVVENQSDMIAGDNTAPLKVSVYGTSSKPYWTIMNRQNRDAYDDGYLGDVQNGSTLIVDSRPSQNIAVLSNGDNNVSVAQSMDFINRNGFVMLQPGSNEITFKNASSYRIDIFEFRSLV